MTDIKSMSLDELNVWLSKLNEPKYRGLQIFKWLHSGVESFDEMTNLSKATREKLKLHSLIAIAECDRKQISKQDGTIKYLWRFSDGNCVESVFMEYRHGNTVCISTQAGCRMGCKFCASTIGGLVRNLAPSEMLEQVLRIGKDTGKPISNIVLMGTGEPLDNYDNVIKFLKLVNDENGLNIGMRHISLSTSGLCDKILKLAEENLPITLSVSLHAPDDETRNRIMPVNRSCGVKKLIETCKSYYTVTGRRISFEYAMISGVSDTDAKALSLCKLLDGFPCHVNLIPLNKIEGGSFNPGTSDSIHRFQVILEKHGLNTTVRRSLGGDIDAACGQLRRKSVSDN